MILSGIEIEQQLGDTIFIEPFDKDCVNPNSYNLKLHNELIVYDSSYLDLKEDNHYKTITIPEDGLMLYPNTLYLGRTVERTITKKFVPMLEGRSSLGRLGLSIHVTAGFGDVGFEGYWTLEVHCIHPIIIYPWIEVCQIYYHTIIGRHRQYCSGKYQGNNDIQTSKMYKELTKEE